MTYELNLFQILKSIKDVKLSGYYYAMYNFMDEVVGTSGLDIVYVDYIVGTAIIVAEYFGHKKILRFTHTEGGNLRHDYNVNRETGIVEFYFKFISGGDTYWRLISNGDDTPVRVRILVDSVRFSYGDGMGGSIYAVYTFTTKFPHFKIEFDCVSDTYSGWCEGNLVVINVPFCYDMKVDYIYKEDIYDSIACEFYYGDVGYSWDLNYNVGDNKKQILYLIREVIERNGKMSV